MKKRVISLLLAFLVSACSSPAPKTPVEFPLSRGTTWVYTYKVYEPAGGSVNAFLNATYQLTEKVADAESTASTSVAHVVREWKLVSADPGWTDDFTAQQNKETWFAVSGAKVYSSGLAVSIETLNVDDLALAYDFPLAVNKTWCPLQFNPKDPSHKRITDCHISGEREVVAHRPYETAAEQFNDCYDLIDHYNGGSILQTYCVGVGIVFLKFDHMGTRFGFQQALLRYTVGTP